jgi:hypothetical protein
MFALVFNSRDKLKFEKLIFKNGNKKREGKEDIL